MDRIEHFFSRGLKLGHLRMLVLLAQLGQVQRVAQQLGVSQPAVSRQLAELENGLGAPVVRRMGNKLVFTDLGQALLARAREMLFHLEQARQELGTLSMGLRGEVAIAAVPTVMQTVAIPLLANLRKRAPKVNVRLVEDTSDKMFALLASGVIHMLFSRTVPSQYADGSIAGEVLFEDPLVIVCASHHPLAQRKDLQPRDLAGTPWILPPRESPAFQALNAWMHTYAAVFADGCVQTTSAGLYRSLLQSGIYLGLMPLSVANGTSVREHVAILELPNSAFLGPIWLFHNRINMTAAVQVALECAQSLDNVRNAAERAT